MPLAYTFTLRQIAIHTQGSALDAHLARGGEKHSGLRVAGLALGTLVMIVGIIFALIVVLPEDALPGN